MDIVLYVVAVLLGIVGIVGSIVPGIAGPPFSFLALVALQFTSDIKSSAAMLVITGVICAVITVLDYVVPVWGTKKFGGTKAGVRGSTIGLIIGLFITFVFPVGFVVVLLGPFFGAYIGEKMADVDDKLAWRSAFGSFVGFLAGTFMKVVYAVVLLIIVIKDIAVAVI